MRRLKSLRRSLAGLIQQAALLPKSLAFAIRGRRRRITEDAAEAERLDRIRNPADYLGK